MNTYIINALRPERSIRIQLYHCSQKIRYRISFLAWFADSVTVDAIARSRENVLSTLSIIAFKEEMRRFTQYSRLNILSTMFFDMDRRAVLVSRRSIGRLLIRPKRNVKFPMYIGDGAYSSIILIVLQKGQNDVFLFEKFSPDVRWKWNLFTVTIS